MLQWVFDDEVRCSCAHTFRHLIWVTSLLYASGCIHENRDVDICKYIARIGHSVYRFPFYSSSCFLYFFTL